MALRAQDVEAAETGDLVVLGLDGLLGLGQRVVPRRLVLLGRLDRVEPALLEGGDGHELGVAAEHDVGTAPRHVGGDGDGALAAGLGDDRGLALVVLGVEHLVRDALAAQLVGEVLALLDAGRADQHRLALAVLVDDVVDHRGELGLLGAVDEVRLVLADHGPVRRDRHHAELVDGVQLGRLGLGGARHARELVVHAEVVLEGDRGQRLVLVLDLDALLRLDRLVHALVVAAPGQQAAGVLVDDEDLAVHDDVVLVVLEQLLGLDGVVQVADQRGVDRLVEVLDAEVVLHLGDAGLQDADGPLLLVDLVVALAGVELAALEHLGDLGELDVPLGGGVGGAADDERGAGLVDEDRVDLVDDGEVVAALDELVHGPGHVVAQVVEAELVVRAVGDVLGVLGTALLGRHRREDDAGLEAEQAVHAAHELGLVLGEVVVDGDDVHALALEGVEVGRQGRDEGLALTGLHLGDVAQVQGGPAHELDVEVALAEGPLGRLADGGEGLREDVVEGLTVGQSLAEDVGLRAQLGIRELLEVLLDRVDLGGQALELLDDASLTGTQQSFDDLGHAVLLKFAAVGGRDLPRLVESARAV